MVMLFSVLTSGDCSTYDPSPVERAPLDIPPYKLPFDPPPRKRDEKAPELPTAVRLPPSRIPLGGVYPIIFPTIKIPNGIN